MRFLLKKAVIIDTQSSFHKEKKDVLIKGGDLLKIADDIPETHIYRTISLENLHISVGWFDSSVNIGEPGFEIDETASNALRVAAQSGFTAIGVNGSTNPVIADETGVRFLKEKSTDTPTKIYPIANLSKANEGKEMAPLYQLQKSGAIAFGDYQKPIGVQLLKIALQYTQAFDGLVVSFPMDSIIKGNGIVNESIHSTRLGLKGIPALAEHLQIIRDLEVLSYTGGRLHIPTISTARSVDLIAAAKSRGLQVTCGVTPHHLLLEDSALNLTDTHTKTLPPLRSKTDQKMLLEGVKEGIIDCICSDHTPINIEDKKVPYQQARYGSIGMESLFGVLRTVLDTETIIDFLTVRPRKIFGMNPLKIAENGTAELTLFNPDGTGVFKDTDIKSTSKNAIFLNYHTVGKTYGVIANAKTNL